MAKLYVVGIGPGGREHFTVKALEAIEQSGVIVGYDFYIDLIEDLLEGKEVIKTGMRDEIERCRIAIDKAKRGLDTCIVSTGDAGLYGMAGPVHEMTEGLEVEVIPGVSSAFCAAAELGAPIMHDFCSISLSDLLTPWEVISKRLRCAAEGDFVIALYNPRSNGRKNHFRRAIDIIEEYKSPDTPVGIVRNAGRPDNEKTLTVLSEIKDDFIDMRTVIIIGNSRTYIKNDKMITPRGYSL